MLSCLCLVMLDLYLGKIMLPIVWNIQNSILSRLCIKELIFKETRLYSYRDKKLQNREKNICLLKVYRNTMTRPTQTAVRTKDHHISSGISQTPWSLHEQIRHPSLSGLLKKKERKKETLNTKSGKMGLRATRPAPSQSAGFPNKVVFPYHNTLSLSLLTWPVVSSTSLDLLTF